MAKHAPLQRAVPQTAVIVAICAVLVGITWLVFAQAVRHQFVTYDDPQYVYANPDISAGVSLPRISWAFTHTIAGNWHPLTTISHMLDCQLYGLKPAGHQDRKSTRLNSSHTVISYAVFCLKKKKKHKTRN